MKNKAVKFVKSIIHLLKKVNGGQSKVVMSSRYFKSFQWLLTLRFGNKSKDISGCKVVNKLGISKF